MLDSPITPLLLGFLFLFMTAARSAWLRISSGANPFVIDQSDALHRFLGIIFGVIVVVLLSYFLALLFFPTVQAYLGTIGWLARQSMRVVAVLIMVLSIVWTGYAQVSMSSSWRVGIPKNERLPLRTNGPFSLSRNPVFLGMLAFVAAVTLWSPSAVTLALLAVTYVTLEVQIRLEEAYLHEIHGDEYRTFQRRVPRWI